MLGFLKKKLLPDAILKTLESAGFAPNSEDAKKAVLQELRDSNHRNGVTCENALFYLGSEQIDLGTFVQLPWYSDDVWVFDFESIESEDSYVQIMNNLARLARDRLGISNVKSSVNFESEEVNFEFMDAKGQVQRWDIKFDDDFADPAVFVNTNTYLARSGSAKQFYQHDLGQACLICFKSSDEIDTINTSTGLNFEKFRN